METSLGSWEPTSGSKEPGSMETTFGSMETTFGSKGTFLYFKGTNVLPKKILNDHLLAQSGLSKKISEILNSAIGQIL